MTIEALPVPSDQSSRRIRADVAKPVLGSVFTYAAFGFSVIFSFAVVFGILN